MNMVNKRSLINRFSKMEWSIATNINITEVEMSIVIEEGPP